MTIFYAADGEILSAHEPDITDERGVSALYAMQPRCVGHLPGMARPEECYIDDGKVKGKGPCPGEFYRFSFTQKAWVQDIALVESAVLRKRTGLLYSSDWTQLPDVPLATKEAWAIYRQALRDITAQAGYPLDIQWPTPPG